jgi:hypothetical protein
MGSIKGSPPYGLHHGSSASTSEVYDKFFGSNTTEGLSANQALHVLFAVLFLACQPSRRKATS